MSRIYINNNWAFGVEERPREAWLRLELDKSGLFADSANEPVIKKSDAIKLHKWLGKVIKKMNQSPVDRKMVLS